MQRLGRAPGIPTEGSPARDKHSNDSLLNCTEVFWAGHQHRGDGDLPFLHSGSWGKGAQGCAGDIPGSSFHHKGSINGEEE